MPELVYADEPAPTEVVVVQGPPMKEELYLPGGTADVLMSRARLDAWQAYQVALTADVRETLAAMRD